MHRTLYGKEHILSEKELREKYNKDPYIIKLRNKENPKCLECGKRNWDYKKDEAWCKECGIIFETFPRKDHPKGCCFKG